MHCDSCDEDKESYKCDRCNKSMCKSCGDLTSSEVKCLQLKERVLKFFCKQCCSLETIVLLQNIIEAKNGEIESKNRIIELLENDVTELKEHSMMTAEQKKKYSDVAKGSQVVVVKPKSDTQKSIVTRKIIQDKLDPADLGVTEVRNVNKGGVALNCRSVKSVENVCKEIEEKMGRDYSVKKAEKNNPRIRIKNVDVSDADDEELFIEKLVVQNLIRNSENIKIISKYKPKMQKKPHSTNVILEINPKTYAEIEGREVLYIGWRTCKTEDYVNVIQCFKCWRFGHMAKECKKLNLICADCGGEHVSCKSEIKSCVNCKFASEVLKIPGVQFNHAAYNRECSVYRRVYTQLQARIDKGPIGVKEKL